MLNDEQFQDLLQRGEPGGVEFKRAIPYAGEARFKVVKAALGLSNRSDGGYVLMGVEDPVQDERVVTGVPDDIVAQWTHDGLANLLDEYADPRVRFDVDYYDSAGGRCIVLRIHEFDELPVICKRDAPGLRRGALYVRPRGKAETVEVGTHEDMRELIDLAVEKALRRFLTRVDRAGGAVHATVAGDPYEHEAEGFL